VHRAASSTGRLEIARSSAARNLIRRYGAEDPRPWGEFPTPENRKDGSIANGDGHNLRRPQWTPSITRLPTPLGRRGRCLLHGPRRAAALDQLLLMGVAAARGPAAAGPPQAARPRADTVDLSNSTWPIPRRHSSRPGRAMKSSTEAPQEIGFPRLLPPPMQYSRPTLNMT